MARDKTTGQDGARPRRTGCRLVLKVFLFAVAVTALACVAAALAAFLGYRHITRPGVRGAEVRVTIPPGASGRDVARILAEQDLVEHELLFRAALRLDRSGKPIKHGRYALHRGLSGLELLHILQQGKTVPLDPSEIPAELKVTVPEGLSIAQAARLFEHPEAFAEAASDPGLIARLGIEAPTLEGFLLPDTYFFDEKPTERDVVERMAAQFQQAYAALMDQAPPPTDYGKLEIVTVASLVEEEARASEERATVAAVIYNRLEKNMPLQLDTTLQYALDKYGQRVLYEDREVDSPYNTYRNAGLPPGPISSPGVASLRAALWPADVGYLFFVSNADGKTHTFSTTQAEHLEAVRRFRRAIARQRAIAPQRRQGTSGQ